MEHFNSLALGLTVDPRMKCAHFYIPRSYLSIEDRLIALEGSQRRLLGQLHQAAQEYIAEGGCLH
jgi:hypothetical protein